MTGAGAAFAIAPAARAALRADVLPFAYAVLSLAVALAGLALMSMRRRRDLGLACFVLGVGLYGTRLLAASHGAELLFGIDPLATAVLHSVLNYLVPIPFIVFCASLLPARWRPLLGWLAGINAAFALVAIPWEWVTRAAGAWSRANSVLVLVTFGLIVALVFRAGPPSWELRRLRASFLVAGFFILCENLRGLGVLPWPEGVEPFGLLLFLIGLGTIVAHRVFAGEARLAAVRRELETARRIQTSILPRELPGIPGLEMAVRYLPAEDVAGDFYDFVPAEGRRLGALVADVSGHGVPAALIASMIKVAVAAQAEHAASPARVLTGMNRIFHGKLRDQFITAVYVFLDLEAGRLTWANAGHPPPLLESAGGAVELAPTGTVMGRLSRADYTERSLPLVPGDRLLLFTDGIPECPSPAGELFGDARLQRFLADRPGLPPEPLAAALLASLASWSGAAGATSATGDEGRADDLTLVVFQVEGGPGSA
jgi:sigma-B regulation protein RsbU (phosphoserine phosphatase)